MNFSDITVVFTVFTWYQIVSGRTWFIVLSAI